MNFRISPPSFVLHHAANERIPLVTTPVDRLCFTGSPNSIAAGIRAAVSEREDGDGVLLAMTVASNTARRGVQIILPIEFDLDWQGYAIAPGALYNGNRFLVSPQPYCPFTPTEGVGPDGPILMADVPRLCSDTGYRTELAANACMIPAVGIYDPRKNLGFLIGLQVYGTWGVTGINLQALPGEPVRVEICLPVMRRRRYRFCDWIAVDNEPGMDLVPDRPVTCEIRILPVPADSIPAFVTRLAEYGHAQRGHESRRAGLPLIEAAELVEAKQDAHNWVEAHGYYRSGIGTGANDRLQTGWVGGGPTFHALSLSPHPLRRQRAVRMMDFICRNGLSPSGYFHGCFDGREWRSFGVKRPGCRSYLLIRRPLECARDVLKTLAVLRARGEPVQLTWESAARRNLDAAVATAARFGHLGYSVDRDTGNVLWGDSACGAFGIEPLVRGGAWFKEPAYLKTATHLAEYYADRFLAKGFTCGGVGDALMAVDSESNYALLAGLVHLHAATGDPQHLAWARQAADLFATWVLCYDAVLPADSPLGRLGIQPRGAVVANIQNQHGAPGICTASGIELLMLAEATGNERYRLMLQDIADCLPQMVVRPGQAAVWGDLPPGSVSERLMTMDGMEPCGHTMRGSTWSEIALLLTARETV
jgi:hypothetical protein